MHRTLIRVVGRSSDRPKRFHGWFLNCPTSLLCCVFLAAIPTFSNPAPAAQPISNAEIEREAEEVVRVYVGLRQLVDPVAADETCKEQITQLAIRILSGREQEAAQVTLNKFIALREALIYEYLVRSARHESFRALRKHFEKDLVSSVVPLPNGH